MPTLGSASHLPAASSLLLYQTLALWSQAELGNSQPVPGPRASEHCLPLLPDTGAPRHAVSQVTLWAESRASWALTVVDEGT